MSQIITIFVTNLKTKNMKDLINYLGLNSLTPSIFKLFLAFALMSLFLVVGQYVPFVTYLAAPFVIYLFLSVLGLTIYGVINTIKDR
jgi:Na+/glutamate symporter